MTTPRGLYGKYRIINNQTGEELAGNFFILRPARDKAARYALQCYADVTPNDHLAADIRAWLEEIAIAAAKGEM